MEILNDEKPRIILTENKIFDNIPQGSTVFDEQFDVKKFKKTFQIVLVRNDHLEMELDLIGIHPFLANTFRRLMLSDVPTMAIDKVHILNNTSIIQEEVLAHRLGLILIKTDPRLFEVKTDHSKRPSDEKDTLEFELKIKCSNNKDLSKKDSSGAEDIYIRTLMALKMDSCWKPEVQIQRGRRGAKLKPGHELDLKLFAIKSNGKDHAKFPPVTTAFYQLLPDIRIVRPVEGRQHIGCKNASRNAS